VSRLASEYGVTAEIESTGYTAARWVEVAAVPPLSGGPSVMAVDRHQRRVILFASEWDLRYFQRHHPQIALLDESPALTPSAGRV
jgi:peptide subunit release factor RF-3